MRLQGLGDRVVAATVTYGERHAMCCEVVDAALRAGAAIAVVIGNGVSDVSWAALRQYFLNDSRVVLHRLLRNGGSAFGFTTAIDAALAESADWVLLLDDDNLVDSSILDIAFGTIRRAKETTIKLAEGSRSIAVACRRSGHWAQDAIMNGSSIDSIYGQAGSSLGFDVFGLLARRTKEKASPDRDIIAVPSAPYGGLLVRADALSRVGRPRNDYVLYQDDTEFTERLVARGTTIVLTAEPLISDIGGANSRPAAGSGLQELLNWSSDDWFRKYYSIRNRVHLDLLRSDGFLSRVRVMVNLALVSGAIVARSGRVPSGRKHLVGYVMAVRDGICGRLGLTVPLPWGGDPAERAPIEPRGSGRREA